MNDAKTHTPARRVNLPYAAGPNHPREPPGASPLCSPPSPPPRATARCRKPFSAPFALYPYAVTAAALHPGRPRRLRRYEGVR
jgi:hypothetical protein